MLFLYFYHIDWGMVGEGEEGTRLRQVTMEGANWMSS